MKHVMGVLGVAAGLMACSTSSVVSEVYLVRHAEKAVGEDPRLTPEGEVRAAALSDRLEGVDLVGVHSTDTQRTRDTAAPTAERFGLEVELYDPRDLESVAEALRARSGSRLVVGHSNTTPELAEALGCGPQEPMPETEYDRLIVVRVAEEGVDCRTERYGG